MTPHRCLVLGLGNPLMGDDGIGPAVVQRLAQPGCPAGLRAEDIGSDLSRLSILWDREPVVWLVDALDLGGQPGTTHRIDHENLLEAPDHHRSVHRLSVAENLRWLVHGDPRLARVRFTLWGAVPESVVRRPSLSLSAHRAVDSLTGTIQSTWARLVEQELGG